MYQLALLLITLSILYVAITVLQRLYFHPLSRYPGPKLAAATHFVDHYYELIHKGGGQFPFAYRKWHLQYGPIIRISPDELHVQDSSWYEYFYSPTRPVRKIEDFAYRFGGEHSAFGQADPKVYRRWRNALNPFFSKKRISEYAPRVQKKAARLMERVNEEYVKPRKVLCATKMWECFAADTVASFAFDKDDGAIESPDFRSKVNESVFNMVENVHWMSFLWYAKLVRNLPDKLTLLVLPEMEHVFAFWKDIDDRISDLLTRNARGEKLDHSLLSSLLEQDPQLHDLSTLRLTDEAKQVVGAGSETVARSLSLAVFHILDQADVKQRLCDELDSAVKNHGIVPGWDELSQLPYLSACIEEAVRLSYGATERRTRIYENGTLVYGDWTIPAGTKVSMDNFDVSHDEAIFPDSYHFKPERWLNDPKAPDGKHLTRYQVSFGKGMRNCVGFQLAYAELFIGVANFFTAPWIQNAALYKTDKSDVEMAYDVFVPRPKRDTKGVRVQFSAHEVGH